MAALSEPPVEDEALAVGEILGQALSVGGGLEGLLVAHHAEEPDFGGGHQFDHPLEHSEPRPQDRHDERFRVGERDAGRRGDRSENVDRSDTHGAGRLVCQQRHKLFDQCTERDGRGVPVAQHRQLVGDQWVIGNVHSHRLKSSGDVVHVHRDGGSRPVSRGEV